MSTDQPKKSYQKAAIEFKSSTLTIPVLLLAETNIAAIKAQLSIKIKQVPGFFKDSPLIIDFKKINSEQLEINLTELLDMTRNASLQTVGIRGGNETINQQAQQLNIAVLAEERKHLANKQQAPTVKKITPPSAEQKPEREQTQQSTSHTKIITYPVRSGQQIYASGDLVILAAVNAGAEIIAEGSIHVYGALRGRALGGVTGNETSRIFCSALYAELISIAGNFQVSENLDQTHLGKPAQISLIKQKLIINEL